MERFGPLEESSEGLFLGDPARRALLLTPSLVLYREQGQILWESQWNDIESFRLDLSASRFALTRWISGILYATLIAAVEDDPGFVPKNGTALLSTLDGEEIVLPVSAHHFGGYWCRSLESTQNMLDHFVCTPESRDRLIKPGAVISSVHAVAHSKGTPNAP